MPSSKVASLLPAAVVLSLIAVLIGGTVEEATYASPGPTAWWKLDETVAGPVVDSSGDNDGTNDGATIGAPGIRGTSYSFDGVDDRVQIPYDPSLDYINDMTLSAWVNPTALGHLSPAFSKERQYYLSIDPGGTVRVIFVQEPNLLGLETSVPVVPTGVWTHLAATANGVSDLHIYINGQEVDTVVIPGTFVQDPDEPVYIGDAPAFADSEFEGFIDDVRIYHQTLAPFEIRAIYADTEHGARVSGAAAIVLRFLPSLMLVVGFVVIARLAFATKDAKN